MADFIKYLTDFFDTAYTLIVDIFTSLGNFYVALSQINGSLGSVLAIFPSFLGAIAFSSFAIIVLLRIVGR